MKINFILEKLTTYRLIKGSLFKKLLSEVSDFYALRDITNWNRVKVSDELAGYVLKNWNISSSQIQQDLFVLFALEEKVGGFFVEFGATDGKLRSNSLLLEKKFAWEGILAEPGKNWHSALLANRSSIISKLCVSSSDGQEVDFFESIHPEYSTMAEFRTLDHHVAARQYGEVYKVNTISLLSLLTQNGAPSFIDYLSLDTEGSEYEILKMFPFNQFSFGVITVEHNFNSNREHIYDLLSMHNYVRVLEEVSGYDDWYINPTIVNVGRLAKA